MPGPASRASVLRLLNLTSNAGCRSCGKTHSVASTARHHAHPHVHSPSALGSGMRGLATPVDLPVGGPPPGNSDYAFEMAASNLRFGEGATSEVGMDFANMLAQLPASERANAKIGVYTDKNVAKLPVMKVVEESLMRAGLNWILFDKCSVEPTESSWNSAIEWTRASKVNLFLAVGGGSVMDTAKAANLFANYPEADLYEFINAPIGRGKPIAKKLSPLIAIPTTAGTGSETTGTAILDIPSKAFKTGIASRALKPTLGIVDINNTATCPREVAISAGLDVLFHSLESVGNNGSQAWMQLTGCPAAYQGSNPISDIFSKWALEQTIKYLPRIARDPHGDTEARGQMLLASSTAGIGFGNAGVHMCHGFSYPISSLNKGRERSKQYMHPSYDPEIPLVPHGVAVSLTAPAVFAFTAPSDPQRHRDAAAIFLGKDRAHELNQVKDADIGRLLSDEIRRFLESVDVPRGLQAVGYSSGDVGRLVEGCIPQRRVLDLAPVLSSELDEQKEQLSKIVEDSMSW